MEQFHRGELVFDVIDEGPAEAPVVITHCQPVPRGGTAYSSTRISALVEGNDTSAIRLRTWV
jgi:hypothetical protein